jgi:hypothetical protein
MPVNAEYPSAALPVQFALLLISEVTRAVRDAITSLCSAADASVAA